MTGQEVDLAKMRRLVHYVCWKCDNPNSLGSIKLNKVLWMSDVASFLTTGKSLTGETYIKRQFGPVPKHILPVLSQLEDEKAIFIRDTEYYGKPKRDFLALRSPDLDAFTAREISLVDNSIEFVCNRNTSRSISEFTHDAIWRLSEIGEEIPLHAMFAIRPGEVTEDDLAWAQSTVKSAS